MQPEIQCIATEMNKRDRMKLFRIQANEINTTYKADNEKHALEIYAKDAGYKSYDDLVSQHGKVDSVKELTDIEKRSFIAGAQSVFDDAEDNGEGIYEPKK